MALGMEMLRSELVERAMLEAMAAGEVLEVVDDGRLGLQVR